MANHRYTALPVCTTNRFSSSNQHLAPAHGEQSRRLVTPRTFWSLIKEFNIWSFLKNLYPGEDRLAKLESKWKQARKKCWYCRIRFRNEHSPFYAVLIRKAALLGVFDLKITLIRMSILELTLSLCASILIKTAFLMVYKGPCIIGKILCFSQLLENHENLPKLYFSSEHESAQSKTMSKDLAFCYEIWILG